MPGRDRLVEIVKESVEQARQAGDSISVASVYPDGVTEATVDRSADVAHAAIDKARDACKVLIRERG